MKKCHPYYKGKRFWSGSVSLRDGKIQETHTFGTAKRWDFHADLYFSLDELRRMNEGQSSFFCIREDGTIQGDPEDLPEWVIQEIRKQIALYFW